MDLTLTGDLASILLAKLNKDEMRKLAEHYVTTIDPNAIGPFLLKDTDYVTELLAIKLEENLEGTIKALQKMPARKGRKRKSNGKGKVKKEVKGTNGEAKQTRTRLSDEDVEKLKGQVLRFVGGMKEGAAAKDIKGQVTFTSQGAYTRVMKELLTSGEIVSEGEKRNTTYSLGAE